jgi:polysaccharide export outer membrane protein
MRVAVGFGNSPRVMLSLVALAVCLAGAQEATAQSPATAAPGRPPATQGRPSATQARTAAAPQGPPTFASPYDRDALAEEYRIAPGDVLQVFVWREPELSREVRVRTDGLVTVPLLGDLSAVNKTPKSLAAELAQQFARFVTSPNVTVTVTYSTTQRFFVVGQVTKPGEFPLLGRTSLLQALALAGGFEEFAKTEEVKVIRQEVSVVEGRARTREIVLPANYKALAQGQNLHQNFLLKPGDVIVVP